MPACTLFSRSSISGISEPSSGNGSIGRTGAAVLAGVFLCEDEALPDSVRGTILKHLRQMATDLARKMVCQWGMSEELGMVEYGDHNEHVFVARDVGSTRSYSEDTAQKIDREVKRLIDNAYNKAKSMLMENRTELDLIAKALLEFETLDGEHIRDLLEHGEMKDPPASPKPPEPPEETKTAKEEKSEDDRKEEDGFGDLAPAGA